MPKTAQPFDLNLQPCKYQLNFLVKSKEIPTGEIGNLEITDNDEPVNNFKVEPAGIAKLTLILDPKLLNTLPFTSWRKTLTSLVNSFETEVLYPYHCAGNKGRLDFEVLRECGVNDADLLIRVFMGAGRGKTTAAIIRSSAGRFDSVPLTPSSQKNSTFVILFCSQYVRKTLTCLSIPVDWSKVETLRYAAVRFL